MQAQAWQECSLLRLLCPIFLRFHPARCWMHWAPEPQRQSLAAWRHLAVGFILLDPRMTPTIQLVLSWCHWADLTFSIARWVLETWQQVQRCDILPKTSKNNLYDSMSTLFLEAAIVHAFNLFIHVLILFHTFSIYLCHSLFYYFALCLESALHAFPFYLEPGSSP